MHQSYAHAYQAEPGQRMMADLWNEFPAEPGRLTHAVSAVLAPTHVGPVYGEGLEQTATRPRPYVDPLPWTLLKHLVQAALAGSVVLFVVSGDKAPVMALGYVATGLLLMGCIVLADRQRFSDPNFEIVEFIAPPPAPVPAQQAPVISHGALVPMVDLMQSVLPERLDVT